MLQQNKLSTVSLEPKSKASASPLTLSDDRRHADLGLRGLQHPSYILVEAEGAVDVKRNRASLVLLNSAVALATKANPEFQKLFSGNVVQRINPASDISACFKDYQLPYKNEVLLVAPPPEDKIAKLISALPQSQQAQARAQLPSYGVFVERAHLANVELAILLVTAALTKVQVLEAAKKGQTTDYTGLLKSNLKQIITQLDNDPTLLGNSLKELTAQGINGNDNRTIMQSLRSYLEDPRKPFLDKTRKANTASGTST